jgi:PAS domain S-box-containing protein
MSGVSTLADALLLSDECKVITMGSPPFSIVHTNRAWSQLTGYKFTEVANRTSGFLQGPHTEKLALQELRAAVHKGQPTQVRVINYTKAGDPFYNTLDVIPLKDKAGTLTHFCGVLAGEPVADGVVPKLERKEALLPPAIASETEETEDTAEKASDDDGEVLCPPLAHIEANGAAAGAAAELLGESEPATKRCKREYRLADAINNTKDAVVLTEATPPYAITHVNQPWCEMCGYTLEEVEGLTNNILQGPDTDQALLDELMASVRRGEAHSARLVNYKKGGVRFVNQVQVMPLYNEADELDHFMAMLQEIDAPVV